MFFAEPYTFVINRDKFRTAYKLLRIEKVDFFFFNFHNNVISEASQQPFKVLRKLKNVVFRIRYMNNHVSVFSPSVFFISPDRFKTESGEFGMGRKVEIFTRMRAAYIVFKK